MTHGWASAAVIGAVLAAACSSGPATVSGKDGGPDAGAVASPDAGAPDGSIAGDGGPVWLASELLGRPTDRSVAINVVPGVAMEVQFEYGTAPGTFSATSQTFVGTAGEPINAELAGLEPDTAYVYRMRWRRPGETELQAAPDRRFHTQRKPGSTFTFTVQADSHLDENSELGVYERMLANALADAPDFHVDLGDTFMCEKHINPFDATAQAAPDYATVERRYLGERAHFGLLAHSAPLFLVNGNHEGETGWLLNSASGDDLPHWASRARLRYYPAPLSGAFYSGGAEVDPYVGERASSYAFTWGDALFVMLDPFWDTSSKPSADGWGFTLGEKQYRWLAQTLSGSEAKYKFVFIHNLVGGLDGQMRGGVEAAPYYEWGGANGDGTPGFAAKRPGWEKTIHQLLVDNGVSVLFHGHDHLYDKQELDGVVYQEVPQPSSRSYTSGPQLAAKQHYASGTILSSPGHLRVRVSPAGATVEYVRAYLPDDENANRKNGHVDDSYTVAPR